MTAIMAISMIPSQRIAAARGTADSFDGLEPVGAVVDWQWFARVQ
jgi:hypothetical protein